MVTKQGALTDREYITLLEAKVDTMERTIARLRGIQARNDMDELVGDGLLIDNRKEI